LCHARTRCDEFRLDYYLQPGDVQLLNNHTCLHTRGAFTDFPVRARAPLEGAHTHVRCGNLIMWQAGKRPHRVHVPVLHASLEVAAVMRCALYVQVLVTILHSCKSAADGWTAF